MSLTVPESKRDFVRATERDVDSLVRKWRRDFPAKSDSEILAMVAYQYASFYGELRKRYEAASDLAEECLGLFPAEPAEEEPEFTPDFQP